MFRLGLLNCLFASCRATVVAEPLRIAVASNFLQVVSSWGHKRILTEPKNALVRQYQQLFAFEGGRLEFTPESLTANARKAIERATGARGLRSVLEALLRRTLFDLPSRPNVTVCRVAEAAVACGSEIELEFRRELTNDPESCLG